MNKRIRILPMAEEYIEGYSVVVDVVARERRYIGFVEAPPLENTRAFVHRILAGAGVQMVAVNPDDKVVGWCDILWNSVEGFRHVGRLGMGLLPEYRGLGIGRRLALDTINAARLAEIERVELEVFASNDRAVALYRALGFVAEGIKRHARKLDNNYDDILVMALHSGKNGPHEAG